MQPDEAHSDAEAIKALIARQFDSLGWQPGRPPDWPAFSATFASGALLFPAARPVVGKTVAAFIERMDALRTSNSLASFEETGLGQVVHVFGNVAVAMAACSMLENGSTLTRDVSAFLLIKDQGAWRIVGQAWDAETEGKTIPEHLSTPGDNA